MSTRRGPDAVEENCDKVEQSPKPITLIYKTKEKASGHYNRGRERA